MKHYLFSIVFLPGVALAHGGHPPVPEAAHLGMHTSILAAFGVVFALLVGFLWFRKLR